MKFAVKIATYVVALFLVASVGFFYLAYAMLDKTFKVFLDDSLKVQNQQILSMIKVAGQTSVAQHLRTISEQNRDMIQGYYNEYLAGAISEDEAKAKALKALGNITIGKTGYAYVINSAGKVVFHPKPGVAGSDVSNYEFIQDQIKKKTGILEYKWKNPGEINERDKVLSMSYFDKWDWIVSASTYKSEFAQLITISDFQDEITSVHIGKSGYVSVLNSKGDFIIHPFYQGKNVVTLDQHSQEIIKTILEKRNGTLSYEWQNTWEKQLRPKKAVFSYVEAYDWYVVSTYYEDEFYGSFQKWMNLFMGIVFSGAALMAVLIIALVRQQSKPLGQLVKALKKGVDGDLTVRVEQKKSRQDEFRELIDYFNVFMENLENTKGRLENEVYIRKQNEIRLRSLTETTSEGYVQMTAGTYITDANKTFCRIMNLEREAILGKPLGEILQDSAKWAFENHMLPVGQGESVRFEMEMKSTCNMDGAEDHQSEQFFMVSASPLFNEEGFVTGSFALLTDISALRQALEERESLLGKYKDLNNSLESKIEERTREMTEYVETLKATRAELLQSEKLSSLGLMISGIANELNSPLGNGITMSSFIEAQSEEIQAKKEEGDLAEEEGLEYIKNVKAASGMILDNLKKASTVLNSLKHIYPEQIKGMKENFALNQLIYEVEEIFKKELRMGAHQFDVVCDDGIFLHSYPKLIKQLLMNLTSNAILHGFRAGYPGSISVRVTETPEEIWIEFNDDGEGIAYQVREKIFEPFFKLDNGSSNLGLGLYTVYNIVTLSLRGTIEWNSMEGMGTRFLIKLPISIKQN